MKTSTDCEKCQFENICPWPVSASALRLMREAWGFAQSSRK